MHRLPVLPRPEQLPAGLADHAVTQRTNALPRDRHLRHVEEPKLRRRGAERPLDHLHRVRALQLEAIRPAAPVAAQQRPDVELELHVVAAGLGVVGDPVQRGRAADEVEPVLLEVKEDHVADHVALRRARHEVLRPVDAEALEAVDRETREQRRRVRPLHRQIVHVVRLVEEDAGLLPRPLLVPPVRVLGRHPRKHVGAGRVVAQQLDRALGRVEQILQTPITHVDPPFSGRRPAQRSRPRLPAGARARPRRQPAGCPAPLSSDP